MKSQDELGPAAPAVFSVSALLVANLLIVGPTSVYAGNAGEYAAAFWSALGPLVAGAAILTVALAALLLAIPRRFRGRPVVFVFSVAVLAWLQGNWLLGDFGLLDGGSLDLEAGAPPRFRDGALWFAGIAAAQLAGRFVLRHAARLAGVFLALQLAALPLVVASGRPPRPESSELPSLVADDAIFDFSSDTNIVLLVLDTLTSDTFVRFADRDPDHYDRAFSGFVVYPDALGVFPSTQYALPVMLGAAPYENRIPVDDYMLESLQREAITGRLLERGYGVDWVSAWPLFCQLASYSTCYAIPRPYASPAAYRGQMAAELFDISLFRHAPYGLKKWLYNGGAWRAQAFLWRDGSPPVFVTSAVEFFADFNARVRLGRERPAFKILHMAGGHGPFVLDAECERVPSRPYIRANYERQARCGLKQTEELLDRLRELGVYDGALIIVAGDHGASFGARPEGSHGLTPQRLARARPLLAVKWPGAKGGLTRSKAPASLQDIAPTIAAFAGLEVALPGRDLAGLGPYARRRRPYGLYVLRKGTPGGHLERVERYAVAARSERPEAWQFDGVVFSPAVDLSGDFVDAGTRDGSDRLSYLGWGPPETAADEGRYVPAVGPVATVFADLPEGAPIELRARLRARSWSLPQVVAIEVDRVRIGSWRIEGSGFGEQSVRIPAELAGGRSIAISFLPEKFQRPGVRKPVSAFDLDWIRLRPLDPDREPE